MSDVKLTLIEARQKISEGWTQGAYARMSNEVDDGGRVPVDSPLATCWCSVGAVSAVTPSGVYSTPYLAKLREILDVPTIADIIQWNDDSFRTKEEVLDLFDRAIAAC